MKRLFIFIMVFMLLTPGLFAIESASESAGGQNSTKAEYNSIESKIVYVEPVLVGNYGTGTFVSNPFAGVWGFFLRVIIGAVGGSLMVLRFAAELVGAVIYEGEDSAGKVRQVIVRFLVHIGVASAGFIAMTIIFA